MTDAELDALDRLCQKATKGPWNTGPETLAGEVWVYAFYGPILEPLHWLRRAGQSVGLFKVREDAVQPKWQPGESSDARKDRFWKQKHADAQFIAAARTALPQLVAEVRRLKERTQELEGKIGVWQRARHDLNQWLTTQPYREQFNRETPRHIQAEAMLLQVKVPE